MKKRADATWYVARDGDGQTSLFFQRPSKIGSGEDMFWWVRDDEAGNDAKIMLDHTFGLKRGQCRRAMLELRDDGQ